MNLHSSIFKKFLEIFSNLRKISRKMITYTSCFISYLSCVWEFIRIINLRGWLIRRVPPSYDCFLFCTNVVIVKILKKGLRLQMLSWFRGRLQPKHHSSLIILIAGQGGLGWREKCCTVSRLGFSLSSAKAWPLKLSSILV